MLSGALTSTVPVPEIRRFNRFYTRQIGVVQEGLLSSPFSLTEVRLLYEIAHRENLTAKALCDDLGLDPGYLSRVLQNFEKRGIIRRIASKEDGRQMLLQLTPKGRRVFAPLETRSNEQVANWVAALSTAQKAELVSAMQTIERLLREDDPAMTNNSPFILRPHQPGDMGWVVHRHGVLYAQQYHYDERFEALVADIVAKFIENFNPKRERCWMAERNGENVGSIFLVRKSDTICKLRLLLVEPSARGLGIGRRLVQECVAFGRRAGYKKMMLWTQSELGAARHLYKEAGFQKVEEQRHKSWGRDDLISETWELKL